MRAAHAVVFLGLLFSQTTFAKPPSAAVLQAQLKKVIAEREALKERLSESDAMQEELAAANKSRDLARSELEACHKELAQIKASLEENRQSGDSILGDLKKAREEAENTKEENGKLIKELEEIRSKLKTLPEEGTILTVTPDITPAKPLNLNKVTPSVKKVDKGVVVVNVLISENGEVLATRLLQGLPGEGEWVQKANEACVESAKKLVFDPALKTNGKIKVRVWQGVGFMLD